MSTPYNLFHSTNTLFPNITLIMIKSIVLWVTHDQSHALWQYTMTNLWITFNILQMTYSQIWSNVEDHFLWINHAQVYIMLGHSMHNLPPNYWWITTKESVEVTYLQYLIKCVAACIIYSQTSDFWQSKNRKIIVIIPCTSGPEPSEFSWCIT